MKKILFLIVLILVFTSGIIYGQDASVYGDRFDKLINSFTRDHDRLSENVEDNLKNEKYLDAFYAVAKIIGFFDGMRQLTQTLFDGWGKYWSGNQRDAYLSVINFCEDKIFEYKEGYQLMLDNTDKFGITQENINRAKSIQDTAANDMFNGRRVF